MKKRHNSPHIHASKTTTRHKNMDIQRIIQDISQLKAENKSNEEIRIMLGLSERTFERYVQRL